MVSASGGRVSVSSWGWLDEDGRPTEDAFFRLWRVRLDGELVALIALPYRGAFDALAFAWRTLGEPT